MKKIIYFIEFLLVEFLFVIFKIVGYKLASNLGFFIGKIKAELFLIVLTKFFGFILGKIMSVVSEYADIQHKLNNKKTRLITCLSIKF